MALDINETIEDDGSFKSSHMVYKDGVKVKYPNKDAETHFAILPALADPSEKASYLPYRDEDTGRFNRWAAPGYYYPFVNKERSILSPKTHDPNAFDPIEEMIKVARAHPEYQIIAGYGPNGKRLTDAYKNPEVKLPSRSTVFCPNAIILYDRETPSDEVFLLQIPSTAFKGQGGEEGKKSTWGLISELGRRNRGSSDDDAFDEKYYWGDITDPRKLVPLKISQEKSPTGGSIKIYNVVPQDDETIKVGKSILEKRYDLEDIYYPIDEKEIIDYLISAFSYVPNLLKMSFASRVPGFEKLLKAATATRSFATQGEDDDDDIPMFKSHPPKKGKTVDEDDDELPEAPKRSKRTAEVADDADDEVPAPTRRSFAPKVDEPAAEEKDEEYAPVTAPIRKKRKAAEPEDEEVKPSASSIRNLIDDED